MKRILSLDGGGIRGIFSIQLLARIEALFREESGRPDLCLADVFDLIAGTSTGAIIAACLSWGRAVADIERLYVNFGPLMFQRQPWRRRWLSKYRVEAIAKCFKDEFREADGSPALMGSKLLKTKLLIVMRNATTGSPWPVSNNPDSRYNARDRLDCNLDVPLWKLLRGSTAAPTYFAPEQIDYGSRQFLFVDGGVTPFNNPSLIAFVTATLPQYRLGWPSGREAIHLISVGTGQERVRLPAKLAAKINFLDQTRILAPAIIDAVSDEQDLVCRILGDCVFGEPIDREVGDLTMPSLLPAAEQKFSYVRYNKLFNSDPGSSLLAKIPIDMQLDHVRNMPMFQQVGREYARDNIKIEHLYPRRLRVG